MSSGRSGHTGEIAQALERSLDALDTARDEIGETFNVDEVGVVSSVEAGIASVTGLPGVAADELVRF